MTSRPGTALGEITVDCLDTVRVGTFWAELLGVELLHDVDGWTRIGPFTDGGPQINFQPVPEPKVGKVRIHLDVWVDDFDAAVSFAESLGATHLEGEVMADPEGHEFCLVSLPSDEDE